MLSPNAHIGWIGFGSMGRPMSRNLLKAGFRVSVYDKDTAKSASIREDGATPVSSPAALAADCDVIVSMIWDDDILRDVVTGPEGVLSKVRPGLTYIDMSTLSVRGSTAVGQELARRNVAYLRAPVSGSTPVARAGTLSIYISGPKESFERCLPIFQALGTKQTYVGTGEEARVFKLAINMMVQTSTAILGEALSFGEKAGVDRARLMDAINDSIVASDHYKVRADSIKRRDMTSMGSSAGVKDIGLVMSMAADVGAALPITALVQQYITVILPPGGPPTNGIVGLATFLDRINGIGVRSPSKE